MGVLSAVSGNCSASDEDGTAPDGGSPKRQFSSAFNYQEEGGDGDIIEDNSQQAEKKRRLSNDQVKFLEMSFEAENKLEPERKILIAKQLGLQPRQVAVWFQNRRARWKTKQLEREYDALKANYDAICKENEKLQAEVARLTTLLNISDGNKGRSTESECKETDMANRGSHLPVNLHMGMGSQNAGDKIEEQTYEELYSRAAKSDLESPTKSGLSEVLDSGCYTTPLAIVTGLQVKSTENGAPPPVLLRNEELSVLPSEETFGNMYNPVIVQQVALKLENGLYSEEGCNFIFSWEEDGMFPWCD
eukprot:c28275_g1_i1 orf=922-1833(-)